jgi:lipopolysaccharide/colanic/teichoic acid biosynthesis glycosyltransferase
MYQTMIRLLDIIISLAALIILFPVFLIVAILVFLDLGTSVLFIQKRFGQDGKVFNMLKFRSMRNVELDPTEQVEKVNKYTIKLKNDPRITRFGAIIRKTSIDELPQLLNVLAGNMSLVGPRPWVPQEYENFPKEWYSRLQTKPGVTGLAQINGRSDLPMEDIIRFDNEWASRYCVSFYIEILIKTALSIVKGKNTY